MADLPWGAQAAATLPEAVEAEAAAAEARADAAADSTAAACGWSDAGFAPGAGAAEGEGGGGGSGKAGLQAGRACLERRGAHAATGTTTASAATSPG